MREGWRSVICSLVGWAWCNLFDVISLDVSVVLTGTVWLSGCSLVCADPPWHPVGHIPMLQCRDVTVRRSGPKTLVFNVFNQSQVCVSE